jgi:hypothetical protein
MICVSGIKFVGLCSGELVHVILEAEAFRRLYLEKAYDTCWRHHIVCTLHWWRSAFCEELYRGSNTGNTKSEKMTIDNGVVQGAVLSVTLFLIVIREMASNERPGPRKNQTILSLGRRKNANTNCRNMRTTEYFIQGIIRCSRPKTICKQHSKEWQNDLKQMASESLKKKPKSCIYAVYD